MDTNGEGFLYLKATFSKLSDGKLKESIFTDRQLRQLMKNKTFERKLNDGELCAYTSLKVVIKGF